MVTKNHAITLFLRIPTIFILCLLFAASTGNVNANKIPLKNRSVSNDGHSTTIFNSAAQESKSLNFSKTSLSFTGQQGASIPDQTVSLSASEGTPSFTLSDDPDSSQWLILPKNPTLGTLSFGVRQNLPPGTYNTTVFAIDQPDAGYANAQIAISLVITGDSSGPMISTNLDELIFETVTNNQADQADTKELVITNTGNAALVINDLSISGSFGSQYDPIANGSNQPIAPGASRNISVTYAPELSDADLGYQDARLTIKSNAANNPNRTIGLFALKKSGLEDQAEPPLQDVVNTLGININVGWTSLADGTETVLKGDEVFVQKWKRASNGPITITPVARYSPQEVLPFGWYSTNGGEVRENEVGILANGLVNAQRLFPPIAAGTTEFEPGNTEFGIYVYSNSFNRFNYTEDGLNADPALRRARIYPYKDRQGNSVKNSYLVTFEDATNGDYQDYMFVLENVSPVSLRPIISLNKDSFVGDALTQGNATATQQFTLTNTGNSVLSNLTAQITGAAAQQFTVSDLPSKLGTGKSANFTISFNPSSNGPQFAKANFSATNAATVSIPLNGLGKAGTGGTAEPSLQWVLDTQLGSGTINVGDTNAATNIIDLPSGSSYNSLLGDEVDVQSFKKANEQPVSIEVLSTFGPEDNNPVVTFGWYTSGNAGQTKELAKITNTDGNGQRLNPKVDGALSFDPAKQNFGFYSKWPFFNNRALYSEDALNTFQGAIPHHVRVYKLPSEENAYVIATEENITGFDYQDLVLLVRNIEPAVTTDDSFKINFSDAATAAPSGYLKDSGSAFGNRGNGKRYGWLNASDNTPANLSENARNRGVNGVSILQNTLIHMQYGNFSTNGSNAYLPDAKWEIELPNGTYSVTVGVGDPDVEAETNQIPSHTINAETTTIINKFKPSGAQGAQTRFKTATKVIVVQDGRLTLTPTGGFNTKINYVEIKPTAQELPYFTDVTPADNATDVAIRDFQITVGIFVPNGYELDKNTTAGNVQLFEISNSGEEILLPTNSNDTGGGDAITLTPRNTLKEFTNYVFKINNIEANRLDDLNDRLDFVPFQSSFTTGAVKDVPTPTRDLSGVKFTKILGGEGLGEGTSNQLFSSLVIGPDGKLYASTLGDFQSDATIQRWDIKADGTLANLQILRPILNGAPHPVTGKNDNNNRIIIGLAFDPSSTADNLIAYVSHSMASVTQGPEWDGIITRLSGPDLSVVQDVVVHLPRSIKDHLTNSIIFDDAGFMYFSQGSNSAGGSPDSTWGMRKERLLSGAILKLDLSKLPSALPIDAYTTDNIDIINSAPANRTTMSDGTYNPYATNSPLTIFATGTRNTYDLLWHSNGWLYMPTNGTAGNNINSPITPSTSSYKLARRIDGRTSVTSAPQVRGGETQKDWLFKTRGGTYHGHPNPYRGEFILNHGGLPYSGLPGQNESSYIDVQKYPRGLGPDANYLEPAYDFGLNKSPNGVIEYKGDAFGGRLKGLIMVVRFSGQDDLLVMDPASDGDINEVYLDIPGLSGFDDPLDVIEDPKTGNLYVSEYDRDQDGTPRLTLLRANDPAQQQPEITATSKKVLFETVINDQGAQTQTREISIKNTGLAALKISSIALQGAFASQFNALDVKGQQTLAPGSSIKFSVTYAPDLNTEDLGFQDAQIVIASNSVDNPNFTINLNGLKKQGFENDFEPPLQDIVNTLGLGVNVGWTSLTTSTEPALQGDEIQFSQWIQATDEPVTITPVGRYSSAEELPFGWFTTTGALKRNKIGTLTNGLDNAQRLFPPVASGDTIFNPGGSLFGIYVYSDAFKRYSYSQDSLNTDGVNHRVRSYPIKDDKGNLINNKYLITFEDASNGDYQDYIFILNNVIPFNSGDLTLSFDEQSLSYFSLPDSNNPPAKKVTLSASGVVNAENIELTASKPWVILPQNVALDTPLDIGINTQNLSPGKYSATVIAKANNYKQATLTVNLNITEDLNYTYAFNFQNLNRKEVSPEGYRNDFGLPFNGQASANGDLTYGWVQTGTNTPASSVVNGRNRNTGLNDDVLLKTFTQIGHRDANLYPTRDWLVNLPNGSYAVNLSVGDPDFSDSNHVININGETVLSFNQENDPEKRSFFESTAEVNITNGVLRLSLGAGGVNAKVNYLRIAPIEAPQSPPQITVTFNGVENELNNYRGSVGITLAANAVNENGSIKSLTYSLDGGSYQTYASVLNVSTTGAHTLLVKAQDNQGTTVTANYYFTISPASNALLYVENMTKVPGTQEGFPADDYYTFYRIGKPGQAITHDSNVLRINNTGTANLVVTDISISDTRAYSFSYVNRNGSNYSLPLTIAPGQFVDLNLKLIGSTTNGNNKIFKETISIKTNADNSSDYVSTLHGGFAPQPEGGSNGVSDEITAQEVFNSFGYRTSMQSIVNDQGTITPNNPVPTRPSSNAPNSANINAGYEGDMILAKSFVQADPASPIRVMQLSAFHGYTPGTLKFVSVNGSGTVGGINAVHTNRYYQTLLPKNSKGVINNDVATRITTPFRIAIENYLNTGGNDLRGTDPAVLGLRVYKVINRDGEVVPNQYIVLQDYVQNGCGAGSANCDWNDNTFLISNIQPQEKPSVSKIAPYYAYQEERFSYSLANSFVRGYAGNTFRFEAVPSGGTAQPNWLSFDSDSGTFSGTPPVDALDSYTFTITATDANGIELSEEFTLFTIKRGDPNTFSLRINAGGPDQAYDGRAFVSDRYFNAGGVFKNNRAQVAELFKTERSDDALFGYSIPVPDDYKYKVTLHFAEIYWGATGGGPGGVGKRVFDVSLQDSLVLNNYDITAEVGAQKETLKTFDIEVSNGIINIDFSSLARDGGKDFPMVSAIEITPLERIKAKPEAVIIATPTTGTAPLDVDFVGSTSTDDIKVIDYEWTVDDETISNLADFQYTFETVGIYNVVLKVTDGQGLTDTTSVDIQVNANGDNAAPVAVATLNPETGNAPLNVSFTGSNSTDDVAITSYVWTVNDSIVSQEVDFNYTFNKAGNYEVSLTVSDQQGLSDTANLEIKVGSATDNNPPDAVATSDVSSGIAPLGVAFTGSNSTDDVEIVSYVWTVNDSIVSRQADFNYTFEEAQNYRVQLTVADAEGLTDTANLQIIASSVDGNTAPNAVATANILKGAIPLEVTFTGSNSTDDQSIASYDWQIGGETVSTDANFVYIFEQAGNYAVTLTVTDVQGLADTATVNITVTTADGNEPPKAIVETSDPSGNVPLEVTFTGSNSTDDVAVVSYEWMLNGSMISEDPDFTYTFEEKGTYKVSLTVTDAQGLTDTKTVVIEVGQDGPVSIIVYPNPATTAITIQMENAPAKAEKVTIVDARGRIVHTYPMSQDQEQTIYNIQLPVLAAGTYIIIIDDASGHEYIERLIIKNY